MVCTVSSLENPTFRFLPFPWNPGPLEPRPDRPRPRPRPRPSCRDPRLPARPPSILGSEPRAGQIFQFFLIVPSFFFVNMAPIRTVSANYAVCAVPTGQTRAGGGGIGPGGHRDDSGALTCPAPAPPLLCWADSSFEQSPKWRVLTANSSHGLGGNGRAGSRWCS